MTFSDIFKKTFLDGYMAADINIYTAAAALLTVSLFTLEIISIHQFLFC